MFGLIVGLFILPYLYGSIFDCKKNNKVIRIPIGFLVELVVWTICSLPIMLIGRKLTDAIHLFYFITVVGCMVRGIYYVRNLERDSIGVEKCKSFFYSIKKRCRSSLKNFSFVLMIIIVAMQVGRQIFFQYQYGDNRVYVAMVNDMVETDEFYPYNDESGEVQIDIPKKYMLSSWYTYEALLSVSCEIKPLCLIYSILPGYLLIMFYLIMWKLINLFSFGNFVLKVDFIIALALLLELNAEDISSFILYWPTYGKSILMNMVLPLFIISYLQEDVKECRLRNEIFKVLLVFAGCAASTMAIMIMPMLVTLLTIIKIIKEKKIDGINLIMYLVLLLPELMYAILFMK